ncbi:hypothetical protein [Paenibacillus pinihumi]|uniref:hypothetical protein n=1 Tax=Paenibacillus pinihumi TaxID=669462 RepID=UPI000425AF18|nr:hypothetical protein [Paenibacillus pinihumi]
MFVDRYPNFEKGRILKSEMMGNLRDYPRMLTELYWEDYSNGIITGAEIRTGNHHLTVTRGIVKQAGRLYVLYEDYDLPYEATGIETLVKLRFLDPVIRSDMVSYHAEIVLDEKSELEEYELELGRFKLKQGAQLRMNYQSFEDMATEYNTINLIHTQYAGRKRSTVAPAITHYFASELFKRGSRDVLDVSFAMQCLNGRSVERDVIEQYLSARLGTESKAFSNLSIHRSFTRILGGLSNGNTSGVTTQGRLYGGPQRMWVD